MHKFTMLLLMAFACHTNADEASVAQVFKEILAQAKAKSPDYVSVQRLFPKDFTATDYEAVVRRTKHSNFDFNDVGDAGLNWLEAALSVSLYQLAKLPGGETSLIRLLEDQSLSWDGAHSLWLCDAIVKKGAEMLPLLETSIHNHALALRCANIIRSGRKSAL